MAVILQNNPAILLARIADANGVLYTPAAISSIEAVVRDETAKTSSNPISLAPADVMHDPVVTDNPHWPYSEGYNFAAEIPGANFPQANNRYTVTVTFTPAVGATANDNPFKVNFSGLQTQPSY